MDGYRLNGNRATSFLFRMPVMEAHRLEIFEKHRSGDGRRLRLGGVSLKEDSTP